MGGGQPAASFWSLNPHTIPISKVRSIKCSTKVRFSSECIYSNLVAGFTAVHFLAIVVNEMQLRRADPSAVIVPLSSTTTSAGSSEGPSHAKEGGGTVDGCPALTSLLRSMKQYNKDPSAANRYCFAGQTPLMVAIICSQECTAKKLVCFSVDLF